MKTVLVFGVFDVLHPGHEYFLKKAAEQGDIVIACVADDHFVKQSKNRLPIQSQSIRIAKLIESGLVSMAVPGDKVKGEYQVVSKYAPDVICLGHDQKSLKENLQKWLKSCKITIHVVEINSWQRESFSSTILNEHLYRS